MLQGVLTYILRGLETFMHDPDVVRLQQQQQQACLFADDVCAQCHHRHSWNTHAHAHIGGASVLVALFGVLASCSECATGAAGARDRIWWCGEGVVCDIDGGA